MSQKNLHVIVGLGATGFSCARFLTTQSIPFAVTDTRENPPNLAAFQSLYPGTEIVLGNLSDHLLNKASTIILSPGISIREPAIALLAKRGIPVIGDIELFARAVKAPVIAITGTNAKSTVTTLVGKMANACGYQTAVGGNLGTPALDLLLDNPNTNVFVLELSSFQLETTYSLHAKVATILNITPDHMDRYESIADYQAAKHRIYNDCQIAVCNRDDALTESGTLTPNKFYFTLHQPSKNEFGLLKKDDNMYLAFGDEALLSVNALPVKGKHYQANALASLAIGHGFGFPFSPMLQMLREFQGLPHRCQFVRERDGVSWYNDSKGTNIGATQAAIEGLGAEIKGKLILIAGGVGKNADFKTLVPAIQQYARHVVLIGEAAEELARAIGQSVCISFADSMNDAIQQAANLAKPNDSVLLSPACASFDMFNNYAHRGEVFTELVQKLV